MLGEFAPEFRDAFKGPEELAQGFVDVPLRNIMQDLRCDSNFSPIDYYF